MKVQPTKNCLRCCERSLERSGRSYRCRSCGFIENNHLTASDLVEDSQERMGRTLDLVEIFNLVSRRRKARSYD